MKATYKMELEQVTELRQQLEKLAKSFQDSGDPVLSFVASKIHEGVGPVVESEIYLDD